jgi:hypothetical protein
MSDGARANYVTREVIMKLLSDEEVSKVSNVETATTLDVGAEYLDLEQLDLGIQKVSTTTKLVMGHVLPRRSVGGETWSEILGVMSGERAIRR